MEQVVKGKVWKFGDNVNTDVIIPGRYCHITDLAELSKHVMEDEDPEFAGKVDKGDIMVGGHNFGCGSSRELAPITIKAAGVTCVVAKSFARIFFRNCINIGLPIIESPEFCDGVSQNDEVEVNFSGGLIKNISQGKEYKIAPFPDFIQKIIDSGGLLKTKELFG